jgi:Alpha amylase, catalytic domain
LNLLDSHDTERVLWTLTPGAGTAADKERNADNLAEGVRRMELAALIQFTIPGAPMIYYGDEVGVTGDDDPDDRRTYPWPDTGASPDGALLAHYQALASLRRTNPVLTEGDLRFLLVGSDDEGSIAYGRRGAESAAIVAVNRSPEARELVIPVAGLVPDGTRFDMPFAIGEVHDEPIIATSGEISVDVAALGGVLLLVSGADLEAPAAPANLVLEGGQFDHGESPGAVGYNLYASPVSGGGYVRVASLADAPPGSRYFVVTALDEAGNESGYSNEVEITPPS